MKQGQETMEEIQEAHNLCQPVGIGFLHTCLCFMLAYLMCMLQCVHVRV